MSQERKGFLYVTGVESYLLSFFKMSQEKEMFLYVTGVKQKVLLFERFFILFIF